MCKRGENIYKRKDGRYEGRYVIGKKANGKTRFGYVFGHQYADVRRRLTEKKAEIAAQKNESYPKRGALADWLNTWMEQDIAGRVKQSSYQTYNSL